MNYKVGDRVVVVSGEDESLIFKTGKVIDIDPEWIYPYEIQFDDDSLNGLEANTLFGNKEIVLESEFAKRHDEVIKPVEQVSDTTEEGEMWLTGIANVTPLSSDIITDIRLLVERIRKEYPQCRETSLAITKLDEARMWLNETGN
jgi:hypothetical protein